jgi:hypothetical protein
LRRPPGSTCSPIRRLSGAFMLVADGMRDQYNSYDGHKL